MNFFFCSRKIYTINRKRKHIKEFFKMWHTTDQGSSQQQPKCPKAVGQINKSRSRKLHSGKMKEIQVHTSGMMLRNIKQWTARKQIQVWFKETKNAKLIYCLRIQVYVIKPLKILINIRFRAMVTLKQEPTNWMWGAPMGFQGHTYEMVGTWVLHCCFLSPAHILFLEKQLCGLLCADN